MGVNGKKIVYATDVELDHIFKGDIAHPEDEVLAREYLQFIAGAELLIADGQYTAEEYSGKRGWGHTSIPLLIDVAAASGVKLLALFHHDPQHSDKFLDEL